jgi:hypothetical protein
MITPNWSIQVSPCDGQESTAGGWSALLIVRIEEDQRTCGFPPVAAAFGGWICTISTTTRTRIGSVSEQRLPYRPERVRTPILRKPRRVTKAPSKSMSAMAKFRQLTHDPGCRQRFVIRVSWAAESSSGQAVEKEIERSNATIPGDDKIGSRVSWWFAGSARHPSNPPGIT